MKWVSMTPTHAYCLTLSLLPAGARKLFSQESRIFKDVFSMEPYNFFWFVLTLDTI